ncbi:MAG: flagellar motor switch protein FliN [Actinomycetes bacterium]|jgi:flagellar motor switch protein FliN/FliY
MTRKTETQPADAAVATAAFPELGNGAGTGALRDVDVLGDVRLEVTVELGRIQMKVRDLLALQEGAVVDLDRTAGAAVDVVVNGTLVARGDVVVVDDELGVRITEVVERR